MITILEHINFLKMISTYHGDITELKVECIVNAANESGLGCFTPNHPCIDNKIHKKAGPDLLKECLSFPELSPNVRIPTGTAKLTKAYNLPSKYIIHATGPSLLKTTDKPDYKMLQQTYTECLNLAYSKGIQEIAFCCISTGMFGYDKKNSAQVAFQTVMDWL